MKRKFLVVLVNLALGIVMAAVVFGVLSGVYVIDGISYCQNHEKANPDIEFEWSFSDGCMFELPDGTRVNLKEYKNRNEFKIEVEK